MTIRWTGHGQGLRQHFSHFTFRMYNAKTLISLGYGATGFIPAALLNRVIHFNLSNENHVHHLVYTDSPCEIIDTCSFSFWCYTCYARYKLRIWKSKEEI
jgi:hypothetical protein